MSRRPPPQLTAAMLRDNRLFQGLDNDMLEGLAADLPVEVAEPGHMVVTEGDVAAHMYVVVSGELEVLAKGGGDRDVRVALFGPGDWFGEMAVLDIQPRSASVRALAPSTLLRLSASDVRRLVYERDVAQYALLIMNVARELSRRLRVADRLIAQSTASLAENYVKQSMFPPAD